MRRSWTQARCARGEWLDRAQGASGESLLSPLLCIIINSSIPPPPLPPPKKKIMSHWGRGSVYSTVNRSLYYFTFFSRRKFELAAIFDVKTTIFFMFLIFILFTPTRWQNKRNFQRACQMGGRFRFKSKSNRNVCYVLSSRQHKTRRYSLSNCKAVTIIKRALLKSCTTKRLHYHNVRTYTWNYLQSWYTASQTTITMIEVYSSLSNKYLQQRRGSSGIYSCFLQCNEFVCIEQPSFASKQRVGVIETD